MADNVVSTPWFLRWRRFRYNVLPVVGFLVCVILTAWMWRNEVTRPNAVGEVEAVRIDVAAANDGQLQLSPGNPWSLFDRVESGQLLARLDDRPLSLHLETLGRELQRLEAEIDAEGARMASDRADRQRDHRQEAVRLGWQAERDRLDMLDRKVLVETERLELDRLNAELEFLDRAAAHTSLSELELDRYRMQRDEAARRLELNEAAFHTAEEHWRKAVGRLSSYSPLEVADAEKLVLPMKASLATQESRIREVELQIRDLEIRAPISGTICSIHRWPGQRVRAGDSVVTLAADQGRYIVSYVRQEQGFRPEPGMPVVVRIRQAGMRSVETSVERVGPQVELIPPHHRHDPAVLEWGQPVRIAPPEALPLRPGELVDITFKTWLHEKRG